MTCLTKISENSFVSSNQALSNLTNQDIKSEISQARMAMNTTNMSTLPRQTVILSKSTAIPSGVKFCCSKCIQHLSQLSLNPLNVNYSFCTEQIF